MNTRFIAPGDVRIGLAVNQNASVPLFVDIIVAVFRFAHVSQSKKQVSVRGGFEHGEPSNLRGLRALIVNTETEQQSIDLGLVSEMSGGTFKLPEMGLPPESEGSVSEFDPNRLVFVHRVQFSQGTPTTFTYFKIAGRIQDFLGQFWKQPLTLESLLPVIFSGTPQPPQEPGGTHTLQLNFQGNVLGKDGIAAHGVFVSAVDGPLQPEMPQFQNVSGDIHLVLPQGRVLVCVPAPGQFPIWNLEFSSKRHPSDSPTTYTSAAFFLTQQGQSFTGIILFDVSLGPTGGTVSLAAGATGFGPPGPIASQQFQYPGSYNPSLEYKLVLHRDGPSISVRVFQGNTEIIPPPNQPVPAITMPQPIIDAINFSIFAISGGFDNLSIWLDDVIFDVLS